MPNPDTLPTTQQRGLQGFIVPPSIHHYTRREKKEKKKERERQYHLSHPPHPFRPLISLPLSSTQSCLTSSTSKHSDTHIPRPSSTKLSTTSPSNNPHPFFAPDCFPSLPNRIKHSRQAWCGPVCARPPSYAADALTSSSPNPAFERRPIVK